MHKILYGYLIHHRSLPLPGIGTIYLQRHSAKLDFGNKQLAPPFYTFKMESATDKPSRKLFEWLSLVLGISEWDAIKSVNDFAIELKNRISSTGEAPWDNLGIIRRDDKGNFTMDSSPTGMTGEEPVPAEKVIREKAEHILLVGEKERSSSEMEVLFSESPSVKNYAWTIAILLTVLSLMFIGWHFSEKGFHPRSAGNQSVIQSK